MACLSTARSEMVIPCFDHNGKLLGVLDIDSEQPAFFTKRDTNALNRLMCALFKSDKS